MASRVDEKGDTGFTVHFGDRSVLFIVDSPATALGWRERLTEAMEAQ
jgi:hypothetical protein